MLGAGEELHGAHHGDVVPRPELVPRVAAQSCSRVAASPQVGSFREEAILGAASFILIGHHVEIILCIALYFNNSFSPFKKYLRIFLEDISFKSVQC